MSGASGGSSLEARSLQPVSWRPWNEPVTLLGAAVASALAIGLAAAWSPWLTLGMAILGALFVLVLAWPASATYLLLGLTPLLAGMDRGSVLPLVRPHEALALVLAAFLLVRGVVRVWAGARWRVEVRPIDLALIALAVTSSVVPLLWQLTRGLEVTQDDLLHALTLWKYLGLYVLVRCTIRSEAQVARCLWVALGSAAIVAIIAILQSLQVLGVAELLATHYAPFGNERAVANARGTSTLGSSIAVADLMAYSLAIALGLLLRGSRSRRTLIVLSVIFAIGVFGAGQFSGVIALLLAVAAVGWITGQLGRVLAAVVPSSALGVLLLWPVVATRLSGFDSPDGLPHSWVGRLENLRTFFWPELFSNYNVLLGVRSSSRVAATETWREWVWIESGHTWLLWSGGLPLFAAFVLFVVIAVRDVSRVARRRSDAIGAAAIAAFSALCVMATLMLLDQHLTLRGSADLLFPLLALALTGAVRSSSDPPDVGTGPDHKEATWGS